MGRGDAAPRIGDTMHVTFGAHADGNTWPEHGGTGSASFGAPVVGPAGLVSLLEAELGLGGPPSSLLDRVVAWQAKLEAADGRGRFWTRSLAADAWATARLLLSCRDELVAAGWRPDAGPSPPCSGQVPPSACAPKVTCMVSPIRGPLAAGPRPTCTAFPRGRTEMGWAWGIG